MVSFHGGTGNANDATVGVANLVGKANDATVGVHDATVGVANLVGKANDATVGVYDEAVGVANLVGKANHATVGVYNFNSERQRQREELMNQLINGLNRLGIINILDPSLNLGLSKTDVIETVLTVFILNYKRIKTEG